MLVCAFTKHTFSPRFVRFPASASACIYATHVLTTFYKVLHAESVACLQVATWRRRRVFQATGTGSRKPRFFLGLWNLYGGSFLFPISGYQGLRIPGSQDPDLRISGSQDLGTSGKVSTLVNLFTKHTF